MGARIHPWKGAFWVSIDILKPADRRVAVMRPMATDTLATCYSKLQNLISKFELYFQPRYMQRPHQDLESYYIGQGDSTKRDKMYNLGPR